jgi:hypothetical protein
VFAISGDGSTQVWKFDTAAPIIGGVAVANGVVYVQDVGGVLYAVNAATGRELARVETHSALSGPAVSRGQIYLGDGNLLVDLNPFAPQPHGSIVALGLDTRTGAPGPQGHARIAAAQADRVATDESVAALRSVEVSISPFAGCYLMSNTVITISDSGRIQGDSVRESVRGSISNTGDIQITVVVTSWGGIPTPGRPGHGSRTTFTATGHGDLDEEGNLYGLVEWQSTLGTVTAPFLWTRCG